MSILKRLTGWLRGEKAHGAFWTEGPTIGGVTDTEPNARGLMRGYREVVYTCVNLLARGVAQTPLRLYRAALPSITQGRRFKTLANTQPVAKAMLRHLRTKEGLAPWMREDADVEEVVGGHLFYGVWQDGNLLLTGSQLRRTMQAQIDLVGSAYILIQMGDDGLPIGLLPLAPDSMNVIVDDDGLPVGYVQKRHGSDGRVEEVFYDAEEIMRPYVPSPSDPIEGHSPLEAVGLSAKLYHDFQTYESALMDNGGVPGTSYNFPAGISEQERKRLETMMRQKFAGPRNAGKVHFTIGEVTATQIGLSQRDMQFREGGDITRDRIANAYNVPISYFTETATYANALVGEYSLAKHGIAPRLTVLEDAINRSLIPLFGDPTIFAAFDDPVPAQEEARLENAKVVVATSGIVTINEARASLGLDPLDELDDMLLEAPKQPMALPVAAQNAPEALKPDNTTPPADDDEKVVSSRTWWETLEAPCECYTKATGPGVVDPDPSLMKSLRAFFGFVLDDVRENGQLDVEGGYLFNVELAESRLAAESEVFIRNFLLAGTELGRSRVDRVTKATEDVSIAFDVQYPQVTEYLASEPLKFAKAISTTLDVRLRAELAAGLTNGENLHGLMKRVKTVFTAYDRNHIEMIARTEEARAMGRGELEAYRQSGVVKGHKWLASADACEFCLQVEAESDARGVTGLEESYVQLGSDTPSINPDSQARLQNDYEDVQAPPLHPHCMCTLIPVLG